MFKTTQMKYDQHQPQWEKELIRILIIIINSKHIGI